MSNKVENKVKNKVSLGWVAQGITQEASSRHAPPLGLDQFLNRCVQEAIEKVQRNLIKEVLNQSLRLVFEVRDPSLLFKQNETRKLTEHVTFELEKIIADRLEKHPLHEEPYAEKANEV